MIRGRLISFTMDKEEAKYLESTEWGGDLGVRLLAIGLQRDIVVITSGGVGSYICKKISS